MVLVGRLPGAAGEFRLFVLLDLVESAGLEAISSPFTSEVC